MKKWSLVIIVLMTCARCAKPKTEMLVVNPIAVERVNEIVEVPWQQVQAGIREATPENILVLDAAGKQLPSQVVYAGHSEPQSLIFQLSVPASGETLCRLATGVREAYPVQAYGRFVPERFDDYAWENNVTAYRLYGPALTDPVSPGIDVWVKDTERMVIDERYKRGHYHENLGDGMDCYKVGPTLGAGACGPFIDGKVILSGNYATQERLDNGPLRTSVRLTYAPFAVGDQLVSMVKVITLDANCYLNRMTNTYSGSFDRLPVAAGVVKHDVKGEFIGEDYAGMVEAASDSRQPEVDGDIALALFMPGAEAITEADGHLLAVKTVSPGEPMEYWSGAGWSGAGILDEGIWQLAILSERQRIENPLLVMWQ